MRIIHNFECSLPQYWPENAQEEIYLVEDGDETTLHVVYQDAHFVRPLAPWTLSQMRAVHQSQEDYERQHHEV